VMLNQGNQGIRKNMSQGIKSTRKIFYIYEGLVII
jgi:hypothetical protein